MSNIDCEELEKRALKDLSNRARSGIPLYLGVWLVITLTNRLYSDLPLFFYLNTAIMVGFSILRVAHYISVTSRPGLPVRFMTGSLIFIILLASLHWGVILGWTLLDDRLAGIRDLMVIVIAAFAIGGAVVLSISRIIGILYPVFMFLPGVAILFYLGDTEGWILGALMLMATAYVQSTTRIAYSDYWESIRNQFIAEERATLMEKLSSTDPLTKLKNRLYFDRKFDEEWQRCSRMDIPLSVLIIDLDHFKDINDQHGHLLGDECLRRVAATISAKLLRSSDCVARFGGEEFVALLPNTGQQAMRGIAESLVKAIARTGMTVDGQQIGLTCSIGGATTHPDYRDEPETLLKQADEALYQAKHQGRNQYQSAKPRAATAC